MTDRSVRHSRCIINVIVGNVWLIQAELALRNSQSSVTSFRFGISLNRIDLAFHERNVDRSKDNKIIIRSGMCEKYVDRKKTAEGKTRFNGIA